MTLGHYARDPEWGVPEVARTRLEQGAAPAPARRSGSPDVQAILDLQRNAGNAAVAHLFRGHHVTAPAAVVQRQDEEYEEGGQSWATAEGSATSSDSSGESSGETYGPPPPPEWGEEGGQSASGEEAPAEAPGGGSDYSGGGGGGGSGGGGEAAPGEESGSWWPFGGDSEEAPAQEAPGGDEGGGSSWWPFGGGSEESPSGGGGGDSGGSSWWPFGGEDETPKNEPGAGDEAGEHSDEEMQAKEEEGQIGVVSDVYVTTTGSPIYSAAGSVGPGAGQSMGAFHDGGRQGTVPFRDEMIEDHKDGKPHAITTGGKTGTRAWAGGGGAGPKGNQSTGTFSKQDIPRYDTDWGGLATNASAWVIPGTGIFDVHRDYQSSDPGDQGNGWWISGKAASALEAHEQRHLDSAKGVYASNIQPMMDRIANSKKAGFQTAYRSANAIILLEKYVNWQKSIEKWSAEDAQYNANNGQIDTEDLTSPRYPVPMKGPKKIEGKEYEKYLIMSGEQPSE